MPSADDIARSIEPGSTEYGDRQVVEDRIRQVAQGPAPQPEPGARSGATVDKLGQGGVSDLPITDGLSLGPGAGPRQQVNIAASPNAEKLRLIAQNARSPRLRALARSALRTEVSGR